MSNIERSERWLEIVKEDLSVAEDLYKTLCSFYVSSGHREDSQVLLVCVPRR